MKFNYLTDVRLSQLLYRKLNFDKNEKHEHSQAIHHHQNRVITIHSSRQTHHNFHGDLLSL